MQSIQLSAAPWVKVTHFPNEMPSKTSCAERREDVETETWFIRLINGRSSCCPLIVTSLGGKHELWCPGFFFSVFTRFLPFIYKSTQLIEFIIFLLDKKQNIERKASLMEKSVSRVLNSNPCFTGCVTLGWLHPSPPLYPCIRRRVSQPSTLVAWEH